MLRLTCSECGAVISCDESEAVYEFDFIYVACYNCGGTIKIQCETAIPKNTQAEIALPVLEIGRIVKITNKEHVWHNELGIITAVKHKHYRLEIHGQLIWVPEEWVEYNEPHDTN